MAISPNGLINTFKNPQLSEKDKAQMAKIEKKIDDDIIRAYGSKFNMDMGFIPDGFSTFVYANSYITDISLDSSVLSRAYLLNRYKNQGWDIKIRDTWTWVMKFNLAELRNNTIDDILDDENDEDF